MFMRCQFLEQVFGRISGALWLFGSVIYMQLCLEAVHRSVTMLLLYCAALRMPCAQDYTCRD